LTWFLALLYLKDIYLGLVMDDDVTAVAEESTQPEEVNFMDGLLSE